MVFNQEFEYGNTENRFLLRIGFGRAAKNMNTKRFDEFVESNPRKMGGTAVFRGTRVPIQNLFDYLEGGDNLEVFLDHFPTVSRDQVIGVLELFKVELLGDYEIAA